MIGAYVASTFYLSARLPFAVAVPVAMVVTGADRPGHRTGAAPAGEQGLRPDADRHDRVGHRARGGRHPDLVLVRARACPPRCRRRRWTSAASGSAPYDLLVIAVTAVAMVALTLFLQRTKRGAAMQAVAMDHEAATAVGIHVGRSNAIAFAIGAGLAALAGGAGRPDAVRQPDHGRLAGHQGVRGGHPRRLRQHPRRDRRRPRHRRDRLVRRAVSSRATPTWSPSWCSPCSS